MHMRSSNFNIITSWVTLLALCALIFILLMLFNQFPQIDIAVASYFFDAFPCEPSTDEKICGTFNAANNQFLATLRHVLQAIPLIIAAGLILHLVRKFHLKAPITSYLTYHAPISLLVTLALGPGVVVNLVLKEISGRPRPIQAELFGGNFPFVEAGKFSDYCTSNCSFVSGEGALGFWYICLTVLLPAKLRKAGIVLSIIIAIFMALLRVAFGKHYISDVVIGGLITLVIFCAMSLVMYRHYCQLNSTINK